MTHRTSSTTTSAGRVAVMRLIPTDIVGADDRRARAAPGRPRLLRPHASTSRSSPTPASSRSSSSATSRSTTRPARCAACTARSRPRPRPSSSAAPAGAIVDVDRRPARRARRPTCSTSAVELTAENRRALYVPPYLRARLPDARPTAPRSSTRSAGATRPAPSAACGTTTRRSASAWPLPVDVDLATRTRPGRCCADGSAGLRTAPSTRAVRLDRRVILVDSALAAPAEGRPIRVAHGRRRASWAAGWPTRSSTACPGMELVAIANRTVASARCAPTPRPASTTSRVVDDRRGARGRGRARHARSSPRTPALLLAAGQVDCLVDVTGAVEFGAHVTARRDRRAASTSSR